MTTQQQAPAGHASTHEPTRRAGKAGGSGKDLPGAGKPWLFGAMGLCLGLGVGLVFGQIAAVPGSASAADTAASAEPLGSTPIQSAVETCEMGDEIGVEVMDEGRSVSLDTSGEESLGASYFDALCVLKELGIPDSAVSRMQNTRALDGNQSAQWGDFSATWGYHPDSGLDVIVETVAGK